MNKDNEKKDVGNWKEKLSVKNLKKDQLVIFLLCGILLVIIAIPTDKGKSDKTQKAQQKTETNTDVPAAEELADYEQKLEQRLKDTLSKVEGVGKVEVMITLKSSSEKVLGRDTQETANITSEEDSEGGKRETKDTSSGKETIYAEGNDGLQSPYIIKEIEPEIEGVVVIAQGGGNSVIAENISQAVMALFQVQAHKIKVMKMN